MPRVLLPLNAGATLNSRTPYAIGNFVVGDPVNHHAFANTGREVLVIRNNGGVSRTLTVKAPTSNVDGLAQTDQSFTLTAADQRILGPLPTVFNQSVDDLVWVDVDSSDWRLEVIRLGS